MPRASAAAELLPPVRIGEVGVDLVDVVRPVDQPALLVVERDIEVARVHELADDTVDRPVELLQVVGRARQLGDPVQGFLHLGGLRVLGFDGLELCQPAARLGKLD